MPTYKTKKKRGYATVNNDEGVNYREIADVMTALGYPMNHSSARNYVLRVIRKFAETITKEYNIRIDNEKLDKIIKSPTFQGGIADLLHILELKRRESNNSK